MIWDSRVWKQELGKELKNFKRFLHEMALVDTEYFALGLEKFYFICAYIIRKLIEANKLSDELTVKKYPCSKYLRTNYEQQLDWVNHHHFESFYNLLKEQSCSLNLRQICNLLIHSFVFSPTFKEDMESMIFTGIFINTDVTRDKCIYHINYKTFFSLIQNVMNDEISNVEYDRLNGIVKKSRDPL